MPIFLTGWPRWWGPTSINIKAQATSKNIQNKHISREGNVRMFASFTLWTIPKAFHPHHPPILLNFLSTSKSWIQGRWYVDDWRWSFKISPSYKIRIDHAPPDHHCAWHQCGCGTRGNVGPRTKHHLLTSTLAFLMNSDSRTWSTICWFDDDWWS